MGIWKVDKLVIDRNYDGDKDVVWTAPADSDVFISFPQGEGDPLRVGNQRITKGKELRVTTPQDAKKLPSGKFEYMLFIYKDKKMAVGGSGPEVEIKP